NIQFGEARNLRNRFIFASAGDARSGTIEFDERLAGRIVFFVKMNRGFELLVYFFREGEAAEWAGMFCFLAVRAAEPFVIDGVLRIERHSFLGAGDRLVVLLQLVVALGEQQKDFGVLGIFGGEFLQELDRLW